MNALQELQLNRIARTQNLQKGENTFGFGVIKSEDIEKAHEVGEIKVGKDGIKRVWTQLANGKFDWRRVKRDKTSQQEPTHQEGKTEDKGGEKHKHEYKIEDAEKYVDKSKVSSAEKKVAKLILSGKSEKGIKQMMSLSKVNSSVVEHVYKLGEKLASEAADEAKRIYKQENNWKSYGGGYTIDDAKKLSREWGISVGEAKEAFNKFEQEFDGSVEWSKNEKYVFTQTDSGTKYKFDPEEESWEKTEEKKSKQTEESKDVLKLKKLGFSKEVDGKEVWFEKTYKNHLLRIVQEDVGNNNWWMAKVESEYLLDADNKPMTFETPLEAAKETIDFVDERRMN